MARNIDPWQRKMIVHMIPSKNRLTTSQMAMMALCSERSITNMRKNLRLFGSSRSPGALQTGQNASLQKATIENVFVLIVTVKFLMKRKKNRTESHTSGPAIKEVVGCFFLGMNESHMRLDPVLSTIECPANRTLK